MCQRSTEVWLVFKRNKYLSSYLQLNTYIFIHRRRQWHPTPVLLPGKSLGQRSLVGYSPCGRRIGHDWMTSLSLFTFIKRLFSSSSLSAIRVVSSEYLRLLIFLPAILRGSDSKVSAYNVGDLGSIPGLGSSPGEGNDNPLQYSCQEYPMDRGAW